MPVFDMIETVLVKKLRFTPGLTLRLIARSTYVGNAPSSSVVTSKMMPCTEETRLMMGCKCSVAAFTMFMGMTFPFFGGLLGFFGGFAFAPTTYFVSDYQRILFHPVNQA